MMMMMMMMIVFKVHDDDDDYDKMTQSGPVIIPCFRLTVMKAMTMTMTMKIMMTMQIMMMTMTMTMTKDRGSSNLLIIPASASFPTTRPLNTNQLFIQTRYYDDDCGGGGEDDDGDDYVDNFGLNLFRCICICIRAKFLPKLISNPPSGRYGFSNPVNYNDNELYCGGFSVQWAQVRI